MGYFAHHAVLVHYGGDASLDEAVEVFRASLPEEFRPLLVGPVPTVANGHRTCVFLPDGSKEWWEISNQGNDLRRAFMDLFEHTHADVAEVRFGGDEPDAAYVHQNFDLFPPKEG